jgi:hypothetical protein
VKLPAPVIGLEPKHGSKSATYVPLKDTLYRVPAASAGTVNPTNIVPGDGDALGVGSGDGACPIGPETTDGPDGGVKTSCAPEVNIPWSFSNTIDVGASGTDVAPSTGYTSVNVGDVNGLQAAMTDFVHDVPAMSASPAVMAKMNRRIGCPHG